MIKNFFVVGMVMVVTAMTLFTCTLPAKNSSDAAQPTVIQSHPVIVESSDGSRYRCQQIGHVEILAIVACEKIKD